MMNQSKRNRGGRMIPGAKRQVYSPDSRPPRQRGPIIDKNMNVDGVFKNPRVTHVVITLVGTFVQVQVKNGTIYEGVLKTVSPKGDIVLEMAHMSEDNTNGSAPSTVQSRDRIIGKLVIKSVDVIMLNAANVDLEYAVKDSFTDSGISKHNGDLKEADLKELQPWDGESSVTDELLDDKSANGWDANDMFKTNAAQFNVKSSYDESLTQYTTVLEKTNSDEYKLREQKAMRLAAEIEGTDQYKKNIAVENGDGDNEEDLFSSVVRPDETRNSQVGSPGGPGKYIPPNRRHGGQPHGNPNAGKQGRGNYQQQYPPPSVQQQHHQQQHSYQQQQARNMHNHHHSLPHHPKHETSSNVNGDDVGRASMPASTAGTTVKTSPVSDHAVPGIDRKQEPNPQYSNKLETKKHNKGRDEKKIQELKEFGSNFKLTDNKEKDKEKDKGSVSESKDNVSDDKETVSSDRGYVDGSTAPPQSVESVSSSSPEQEHQQQRASDALEGSQEHVDGAEKSELPVKSSLNPNAKEFVYNPVKTVPQKQHTHQAPTPPRPQAQSPIVQHAPLMNIGAAPVYHPGSGQQFMMPPGAMLNNNPAYNARPKRAVVSVKPESYPAASAVTGQPLLAQHNPHNPPNYVYMPTPQMMPQPTGYSTGQMLPMPAPSNQRFVTPTSMQGMPPTSIQPNLDQNGQQLYMQAPQQGPMPTHMAHGSQYNIAHLNLSNPNNQQTNSAMNPTPHSGAGHHHPVPSPVHSNPNQQQQQPMNPGAHPPTSGTPQPPQGYNQPTLQNHPPLQPSPHNPTSPQTMQQMPYHTHNPQFPMQSSAGGQQFSIPQHGQQSNMATSLSGYSTSQHMQPQFVMMPNVTPSGQLNHHHLHGSHQFQNHIAGPGSMQPQFIPQPLGQPGQNHGHGPHHHNQMQHFPLQVHSTGGQPVQNYQPAHSSLT